MVDLGDDIGDDIGDGLVYIVLLNLVLKLNIWFYILREIKKVFQFSIIDINIAFHTNSEIGRVMGNRYLFK